VQEAVGKWDGSPSVRFGLERKFEHKTLRDVSNSVLRGSWRGWSAPSPMAPPELKQVAEVFVDLQEARLQADYDNAKAWNPGDVRTKVADVRVAFENWAKIRTHPAANEFLLSLLVGNKRE
jgi:hypothetical protein